MAALSAPARSRLARARRTLAAFGHLAQREWRWLVAIAWLIISAAYIARYSAAIHYLSLGDTDDNMRFLQVRDWLAGQSWWDLRQYRLDPPRGANIHWSRLVDLPIAALMLFFRLFTDQARADALAAGVAPLIPLLLLMFALGFIAKRLSARGHGWFIAMLLPLGANMGLGMFMPMRIDHHGWQLALTATTLAGLVDRKWVRGGIVAGVSSALSVVIGMEMMVYLAGAGALVALRWIFKDGAARRLRPYALSLAGATALGFALFASNANRAPVCDALSPVWTSILVLSGGILYAISLLPLRHWSARLVVAGIGGIVIAAFAWLNWPQCLTGAYQLSDELERSWLVYIREAKPITQQATNVWVPMIALPGAGLVCALAGLWAARRDADRLWAWGTVTLMIAFAIGLTFWQIRAAPAAQLLAIPPVAWAGRGLLDRLFGHGWIGRVAALPGLVLLGCAVSIYGLYPVAAPRITNWFAQATPEQAGNAAAAGTAGNRSAGKGGKARAGAPVASRAGGRGSNNATSNRTAAPNTKRSEALCRTVPALRPLDELPPAVIFTLVDMGPRLIAVTHHMAIAGPYHRNGAAILDIHHAFDGPPQRFREIAAAHDARYLLYCPNFPEGTIYQRRSPNGFYARLSRGETFDFLTPVHLDFIGRLPYTLYRIAPLPRGSTPGRKKGAQ